MSTQQGSQPNYGGRMYAQNAGGHGSLPPSTWGNRQDLSIGGSDPTANMRYANEGMPGAPYYQQRQLAGYYGAPHMSTNGVSDYGRWNWASPMQNQQPPQQPPQQGSPQAPQQPTPQQPNNPAPTNPTNPYTPTPSPPGVHYSAPQGPNGFGRGSADGSGSVNARNNWWAAVANSAGGQGQDLPAWLTGGLTRTG